jgi:hypothetical protein
VIERGDPPARYLAGGASVGGVKKKTLTWSGIAAASADARSFPFDDVTAPRQQKIADARGGTSTVSSRRLTTGPTCFAFRNENVTELTEVAFFAAFRTASLAQVSLSVGGTAYAPDSPLVAGG